MRSTIKAPAIWKVLRLPCGNKIVLSAQYVDGTDLSLYDINHNVFRLNPAGEVVWQVRRDDSNHPPDWWDILHHYARQEGLDGAREPFTYIQIEYPDGRRLSSDRNGDGTNIAVWSPGSTLWLSGSAYQDYILDPETGIAKNVTKWPVRPW